MKVAGLLIDLDGTVFFKGKAIPGAAEAIAALRRRGVRLRFTTNTDSKSTATIATEMRRLGLPIPEEEIITPVSALRQRLEQEGRPPCYFLVSEELQRELDMYVAEDDVRYVVVGDCRDSCSYRALDMAFRHLAQGASLLALQRGRYFVGSDGPHLDTGAFVAALEYASGKEAQVLGKPAPDLLLNAVRNAQLRLEEVAVVGDDVTTDIAAANAIGVPGILVRTGRFQPEEVTNYEVRYVLDSVADVPRILS